MSKNMELEAGDLVSRLRAGAAPGVGLELSDTNKQRAAYWAKVVERNRKLLIEAADTIDRLTSTGEAVPVAWLNLAGFERLDREHLATVSAHKELPDDQPLYTHVSPREGHVEVPVEPWQCDDFVADPGGSSRCHNCGRRRGEHRRFDLGATP